MLSTLASPSIVSAKQWKCEPKTIVGCDGTTPVQIRAPKFGAHKILPGQSSAFISGLRPHRERGVRLEKTIRTVAGQKKFLIHNYGHSGAGITLSFGCAKRARALVEESIAELRKDGVDSADISVAIIGCGVIGLTVAAELQQHHPALKKRILAREIKVEETVSFIAGGQFEPSGIFDVYAKDPTYLHELIRCSHERILKIVDDGDAEKYGIMKRRNFTLLNGRTKPFDDGMPRDVLAKATTINVKCENTVRRLKQYCTWLINPTILLPALLKELSGKMPVEPGTIRSMRHIDQLPEAIVINCTGIGAAGFLDDEKCLRGIRGHLAILEQTGPALDYFFSGGILNTVAYMFARQNDIVVGGTYCAEEQCGTNDKHPCGTEKKVGPGLLTSLQRLYTAVPL